MANETKTLVTWVDEEGFPKAYALGETENADGVREEARYRRDAYVMERACFGDVVSLSEKIEQY